MEVPPTLAEQGPLCRRDRSGRGGCDEKLLHLRPSCLTTTIRQVAWSQIQILWMNLSKASVLLRRAGSALIAHGHPGCPLLSTRFETLKTVRLAGNRARPTRRRIKIGCEPWR